MKNFLLLSIILLAATLAVKSQTTTYLKITLNTNLMSPDHGLLLASEDKVYAHLGLCTCSMDGTGITATRNCDDETENQNYCFSQITPWKSNVWQHVVGNWGENVADDGVGIMTAEPGQAGVFYIDFVIEEYFSDPNLVSTESAGTDVVPSTPWDINSGQPYTIGMVFRNFDGTIAGRDNGGNDLFIVNLQSSPQVIQSSYPEVPFDAITFEKQTSVNEIQKAINKNIVKPNPFRESLSVEYFLAQQESNLEVVVYDMLGQKVRTIFSGEAKKGMNNLKWDGTSDLGTSIRNGLYIVKIKTPTKVIHTERVILQK